MKAIKLLGVSVVAVALSASAAFAKVGVAEHARRAPLPKAITLADNVVVTPTGQAGRLRRRRRPGQVQPAQPVQPVDRRRVARRTGRSSPRIRPHNYMGTISFSALLGGVRAR